MKRKLTALLLALFSAVALPVNHSEAVLKEPSLALDGVQLELEEIDNAARSCTTEERRDGGLTQIAALGRSVSDAPLAQPGCRLFSGKASFYGRGDGFARQKTASGEIMNPNAMAAAMKGFNSKLGKQGIFKAEVECGGRTITVRVNDKGPGGNYPDRVIDLSPAAAKACGFSNGLMAVRVRVCELEKLKGAKRSRKNS